MIRRFSLGFLSVLLMVAVTGATRVANGAEAAGDKAQATFIAAYRAAHAAKDAEAMAKLAWWEGVPDAVKAQWKADVKNSFNQAIKTIVFGKPDPAMAELHFNLAVTGSVEVTYVQTGPSGNAPAARTCNVGMKDGVYYIALPRPAKSTPR